MTVDYQIMDIERERGWLPGTVIGLPRADVIDLLAFWRIRNVPT